MREFTNIYKDEVKRKIILNADPDAAIAAGLTTGTLSVTVSGDTLMFSIFAMNHFVGKFHFTNQE